MSQFGLSKQDDLLIVRMPQAFMRDATREFEDSSLRWIEQNLFGVVFDFSDCRKFNSTSFPTIAKFKLSLKKAGVGLFSINVPTEIKDLIGREGVEGIFGVFDNLEKLNEDRFKKRKNILLAETLNMILEQTFLEYRAAFNFEPQKGQPFVKNGVFVSGTGVLGVINLYEDDLLGVLRFYFPEPFVIQMQRHYRDQVDQTRISQKVIDNIDTFTGNVFDRVQAAFAEKKVTIQNSMPSVLVGVPSQLVPVGKEVSMVFPFKTQYGGFWVEIVRA